MTTIKTKITREIEKAEVEINNLPRILGVAMVSPYLCGKIDGLQKALDIIRNECETCVSHSNESEKEEACK